MQVITTIADFGDCNSQNLTKKTSPHTSWFLYPKIPILFKAYTKNLLLKAYFADKIFSKKLQTFLCHQPL